MVPISASSAIGSSRGCDSIPRAHPDFPRATRFCVARCRDSLQEIGGGDDDEYASEAERLLGRLDGELRYIDVGEIFERGSLPSSMASGQPANVWALRFSDPIS